MTTLILVIGISLGISFLCSILEAVLLSITPPYVAILQDRGHPCSGMLGLVPGGLPGFGPIPTDLFPTAR